MAELAARGARVDSDPQPASPPSMALPSEDAATADGSFQVERMLDELMLWQAAQEKALHHKLWALEEAHATMAIKLEALAKQYTAVVEATRVRDARSASGSTSARLGGLVRSATNRLIITTRRIKPVSDTLTA